MPKTYAHLLDTETSHPAYNAAEYRVIYGDTDQGGIMYHGNFWRLFEFGRAELLRARGTSYKELEGGMGIMLPLSECAAQFHSPALYDDLLLVHTFLTEYTGLRLRFDYRLTRKEDDTLLATAFTRHAFLDVETRRPTRAGKAFMQKWNLTPFPLPTE